MQVQAKQTSGVCLVTELWHGNRSSSYGTEHHVQGLFAASGMKEEVTTTSTPSISKVYT
jgi:hypothetical protein